jgi:hypothetical protein
VQGSEQEMCENERGYAWVHKKLINM